MCQRKCLCFQTHQRESATARVLPWRFVDGRRLAADGAADHDAGAVVVGAVMDGAAWIVWGLDAGGRAGANGGPWVVGDLAIAPDGVAAAVVSDEVAFGVDGGSAGAIAADVDVAGLATATVGPGFGGGGRGDQCQGGEADAECDGFHGLFVFLFGLRKLRRGMLRTIQKFF